MYHKEKMPYSPLGMISPKGVFFKGMLEYQATLPRFYDNIKVSFDIGLFIGLQLQEHLQKWFQKTAKYTK
jgi:hypothetical protein